MTYKHKLRSIPRKTSKGSRKPTNPIVTYLGGAALLGTAAGTGSIILAQGSADTVIATMRPLAVATGLARARPPQEGDYWPNCDSARAAGTAPIYFGEPGYRDGMDGDDDGIACEPYRGS